MKYVIINADDFGLSREINEGILECFKAGVVTNASLIINEFATKDAITRARTAGLPLGLHVNLFCEALSRNQYLFGPEGKIRKILHEREEEHVIHTLLNKEELSNIQDEFEHQFDLFSRMAEEPPNHLDYHLGLHFIAEIFETFVGFARTHELPFRWGTKSSIKPVYTRHPRLWIDSFNGPHVTVKDFLHILDHVEDGINEISVHPGYNTPGLSDRYNREREAELRILLSPEIKQHIQERNISLGDYSVLSK